MDEGNEYGILLDEDRESFSSVVFMVEVGVVEVFIVDCVCVCVCACVCVFIV